MEEGEEEMDMEKRSQGTKGEYGGGGEGDRKGRKSEWHRVLYIYIQDFRAIDSTFNIYFQHFEGDIKCPISEYRYCTR